MNELSLDARYDFEKVLEQYNKMIYRLAYARTGNIHDAEDILQEVFLRYIKSGMIFNSEEHRKAWFLKVTSNCSKNLVTSSWNRRRTCIDEQTLKAENRDFSDVSHNMENSDRKAVVLDAVMSLPEKYRVIIHLFYYEELSIDEICAITGISISSAKTRLHRARKMLKEILKGVEFND